MSELKPCPFCGKEAELRIYKRKRVYRDAPRMGKLSTARVTNIELKTEKQRRRGKVIDVQMEMYTVEWDEYVVTCPDTNCYARNTTRS